MPFDRELEAGFAGLGVVIEAELAGNDDFEIWEENMDSAGLFFALATQWRVVSGRAGLMFLGLDYAAVRALISLEFKPSAKKARRLMRDLMDMEAAALPVLNEAAP